MLLPDKFKYEFERIKWRDWVLSQPGGETWLIEQSRRLNYKENQIGPATLRFEK